MTWACKADELGGTVAFRWVLPCSYTPGARWSTSVVGIRTELLGRLIQVGKEMAAIKQTEASVLHIFPFADIGLYFWKQPKTQR